MPNPDLEIRRGGVGGGVGAVSKNVFSALWTSVWSKNERRGRPPGPLPWIWLHHSQNLKVHVPYLVDNVMGNLLFPQMFLCKQQGK